jgi:hypothetical protein
VIQFALLLALLLVLLLGITQEGVGGARETVR